MERAFIFDFYFLFLFASFLIFLIALFTIDISLMIMQVLIFHSHVFSPWVFAAAVSRVMICSIHNCTIYCKVLLSNTKCMQWVLINWKWHFAAPGSYYQTAFANLSAVIVPWINNFIQPTVQMHLVLLQLGSLLNMEPFCLFFCLTTPSDYSWTRTCFAVIVVRWAFAGAEPSELIG